jgi:hypothetical protein
VNEKFLDGVVERLVRDLVTNETDCVTHPFLDGLIDTTIPVELFRSLNWKRENSMSERFVSYVMETYSLSYGNEVIYVIENFKKGVNKKMRERPGVFIPFNKKYV